MQRKFTLVAALILVLALLLSACAAPAAPPAPAQEEAAPAAEEAAPAEEAMPTEEEAAPAEEEAAPAEAAAGPKLVIWADSTRAPALEALAADFEAEYGASIEIVEVGFGDIRDQFKVAAPAGEGPDIIIGAHDWLGELVVNGLLEPLDLGDKAEQFLDAAVQAFVYEGKLYGMPYATENVAFVYNPEIVAEPPTTWSEVREMAAELEGEGVVEQAYVLQEGDPYHFFPIQTAFGGYVFGLTEEGYDPNDVGIDSPGSIAAAKWLDQMVKEGHLKAGVDWETMHAMFESGKSAMFITGPWSLPRIRESGIPYAITTLPGEVQDAQPFLGVQGFMVSAFSENALLAQTFLLDFVATPETMQAIFEADPRPSAFLPVREAMDDPDLQGFAAAGANGLPMPAIPEMSAVWASWGDAITLIFNQAEDPEVAFKNAAEQIRAAIAGE